MKGSNVVLIGMPGVGKSTLGVVLAKIMGYDFIDTDLVIQKQQGKTLQRIIDERGVDGFIEVENDALKGIVVEHTVISTGGSAVYSDEAMRHLRSGGTVVYLRISLKELKGRLGSLHERGVVMRGGSLADVYAERVPLYERYADLTIGVDGLTVREASRHVLEALARLS